ncbi:MAG: alpha/beta fold hydrolase [Syntrophaceae bacterium]|nr:alpha/beta fold hydrolase [Syntrophaceae bacterium]
MLNRDLYPFKSNYFTINRLKMHYVDEGKGNPVVMVHGNPTWSFYYRNLIKDLSKNYRVIAVDHIGMGLSDKPGDDQYQYTAARRVEDLGALIEHLQLKKFTLVGHDWGGIIGSFYAAQHPEKIAGMILFNTSAFLWPINKNMSLPLSLCRIPFISAFFLRGLNAFSAMAAMRHVGVNYKLPKDVRAGLLHPYDSWKNRISVHRFVQDIPLKPGDPMYDMGLLLESKLKRLKNVPKLFCWGMRDIVFCPKVLAEFQRYFPDAEVHKFQDGHHYVLEDKYKEIIPLVEKFIKEKVSYEERKPVEKKPQEEGFTPLFDHIMDLVRRKPDKVIVAVTVGWKTNGEAIYETRTYRQVDLESNKIAHGLWKIGITKGMHTVLMVTPGTDFFSVLTAILKIGAIPVLVDPGMGMKNLKKCLEEAQPEAFIGIPKAHIGRIILGWAKKTLRIKVTVGKKYFWGGYNLQQVKEKGSDEPYIYEGADPDDMAILAFTSGNTGIPKGVVYTHRILTGQLKVLQEAIYQGREEIDLSTFPPFALFDPASGSMCVIPDMDATKPAAADPKKIVTAIQDQKCTSMFASPMLIEKIGLYCEENNINLPTIRQIVSAGAPARIPSIERLVRHLSPGVQVFTPYGATEALPVTMIGSDVILKETKQITESGGGNCVGQPVKGMEVAVIGITEEPIEKWSDSLRLPPNKIGEITVKGTVVTKEYYKRDLQNRLAKIKDEKTGEIWHRMGDVGYLDDQGRLWMCGRKAHRVETGERTFFSIPCEAIFNNHPKVDRSALVGVKQNGKNVPVMCIQLKKGIQLGSAEKASLTKELLDMAQKHEHTKPIKTVLYHDKFPVDVRHNAKILRENLAVWAQKELS